MSMPHNAAGLAPGARGHTPLLLCIPCSRFGDRRHEHGCQVFTSAPLRYLPEQQAQPPTPVVLATMRTRSHTHLQLMITAISGLVAALSMLAGSVRRARAPGRGPALASCRLGTAFFSPSSPVLGTSCQPSSPQCSGQAHWGGRLLGARSAGFSRIPDVQRCSLQEDGDREADPKGAAGLYGVRMLLQTSPGERLLVKI